jgi:hypothetical protein
MARFKDSLARHRRRQTAMLQFRKDRWTGNHWPSIDIWPNDAVYFLRILAHLSLSYSFPFPRVIDLIDGYAADFQLLASDATIHMDSYTFSLAFADEAVRDRVLADLQALPSDYFEATP